MGLHRTSKFLTQARGPKECQVIHVDDEYPHYLAELVIH